MTKPNLGRLLGSSPALLILEDEATTADHLRRACDVLGLQTVVCHTLPEFHQALSNSAHDIRGFILDIDLGFEQHQGGLDALEIIRARGVSTWAAVFTAHAGRYDRMANTLGSSYFLSKSGDIETDATALLRDWLAHDSRLTHLYLEPTTSPQTSILVGVNDALIAYLARNPAALHTLDPRKFEEIVADLWHQFGYKVQLTPQTRDGGKDIYAAKHDLYGDVLYVIECKKYGRDNPVGVEIVRGLYGVAESERATAGILATTSYFTAPAKEFQKLIPYRLSLHDFDNLRSWLLRWQEIQDRKVR
jgi:HJR/Mrr/RecB family endonuclease